MSETVPLEGQNCNFLVSVFATHLLFRHHFEKLHYPGKGIDDKAKE
jgi:hypothetical protein